MKKLLLACDLDRTVLPNGTQPLSEKAPDWFNKFTSQESVTLAYLTGRDLTLVKQAFLEYQIPIPQIIVGDVGTSMYFYENDDFQAFTPWADQIGLDWHGAGNKDIGELLSGISEIYPQEPEKQKIHKRSYYTDEDIDKTKLIPKIRRKLESHHINAAIIFSIDEAEKKGLLDILPQSATKKHALEFLQKKLNFSPEEVIYAGDSGNDIEPLTSGYPAIVVKNARDDVKDEVQKLGEIKNMLPKIYFAQGEFHGLNGNYTAGILEGVHHFLPEAFDWNASS